MGDSFARSLSEELRHATYRDLLEFREVMECRAVQNIILTASDEQINALYGLLDEPPEEAEAASQLDRYFHFPAAKLSGNRLFSCFIDTYYELIREIKTRSMRTESRRAAVMREHRAILDALRARDVEAAQERCAVIWTLCGLRWKKRTLSRRSQKHAGHAQEAWSACFACERFSPAAR